MGRKRIKRHGDRGGRRGRSRVKGDRWQPGHLVNLPDGTKMRQQRHGPPVDAVARIKPRHRIGNPVADIRRRLDAHEIGICHPPSAHTRDRLPHQGRLAHAALALDDDVLPAGNVCRKLTGQLPALAEMLSADNAPVFERFHNPAPPWCAI